MWRHNREWRFLARFCRPPRRRASDIAVRLWSCSMNWRPMNKLRVWPPSPYGFWVTRNWPWLTWRSSTTGLIRPFLFTPPTSDSLFVLMWIHDVTRRTSRRKLPGCRTCPTGEWWVFLVSCLPLRARRASLTRASNGDEPSWQFSLPGWTARLSLS